MPGELRRAQILEHIRRAGGASVAELAREHGVSAITVHRDLERLAGDGLVERVHGGARALQGDGPAIETDWTKRLRQARAAKEEIGAHAVGWVEDGSTIFVDSSTTCLALARRLEREPPKALTLVTNSPAIALGLHAESVHVIVTPGEVDQNLRMIGGRWAVEFLSELNFDVAFVSAAGLTLDKGLTTTRRALADTLNAARAVSARTVGLIDSSKFGRSSLLSIAEAQELDAIVVDGDLPPETFDEYAGAGVSLVRAEAGATASLT
ncbi:MAG TPA: DeoR/GlpR family DNA-binding transcription regulator [Gaiellaceae bacterium]|nr:DeoR/GlpR family DNA-binding transcription regulator [Gaiellaceae bacterium]